MDSSFSFLWVIVIGAIVIAGMIYSYVQSQKRREALFVFATSVGFEFWQEDPADIPQVYSAFDELTRGYDQKASNVMLGKVGSFSVKCFDYKYVTGSGKNRQTHTFSAVIFDTDLSFYSLLIRPEGFLDRAAGAVGFNDIDFESEEFSRQFFVKCADKKFAYDVIHPQMMQFLLENTGWTINAIGPNIMIRREGEFDPEQFRSAIMFTVSFLKLLPAYLVQQMRMS